MEFSFIAGSARPVNLRHLVNFERKPVALVAADRSMMPGAFENRVVMAQPVAFEQVVDVARRVPSVLADYFALEDAGNAADVLHELEAPLLSAADRGLSHAS